MFYSLVASSYSVFVRSASLVSRSTSRFVTHRTSQGGWEPGVSHAAENSLFVSRSLPRPPYHLYQTLPCQPASKPAILHLWPWWPVGVKRHGVAGATNPGPPVECGQTNKPPLGQRPTRRNDRTNELFVGHVGHVACTLRELRTRGPHNEDVRVNEHVLRTMKMFRLFDMLMSRDRERQVVRLKPDSAKCISES